MKSIIVKTVFLFSLCSSLVTAQEDSLKQVIDTAEYEQALMRLQEFHATVTTLTAQFVQDKIIVPFNDMEESSGSFAMKKPALFMWQFNVPEQQKVVIKEERGYIFNDSLKQTQIFSVEENNFLDFLLAGLSKPLGEYFVNFNVTLFSGIENEQKVYHYKMIPNKEDLKNYVSSCEVSFSQDTLLPVSARLVESSGDVTRIRFSDIKVNEPIDEAQFSTVIPSDYEVLDYRQ
ncbi:outer membrane lipoprotein carrier protein LolA [bacterium]|nr:outer membrane lipoprotein carrier protein LolA [bacterium]MCP5461804.1 outer membrane lipoprotein carrier protein LolA [bacterium]